MNSIEPREFIKKSIHPDDIPEFADLSPMECRLADHMAELFRKFQADVYETLHEEILRLRFEKGVRLTEFEVRLVENPDEFVLEMKTEIDFAHVANEARRIANLIAGELPPAGNA